MNPVVWCEAVPDSTFIVRQVWMAGSNQNVSEPQCFSVFSYAGQFLVLSVGGVGLFLPSSYHAGFTR